MENPLSSTYGLRLGYFLQSADDYHRHRHRVNKKIAKLRRSLGIATKDTRNYKTKEKMSSISSEDYDSSIAYGDVLLYQIERDLLYAEETKLLLDVHLSKAKQKFVTSKYKKAVSNSKKLLNVTKDEKDNFRVLELLVYTAIVNGFLSVSKKRWDIAMNAFSIARCSLQCLYQYQTLPAGLNKELYMDLIDKVTDPVLKAASLEESGLRTPDLTLISRGQAADFSDTIPYLQRAVDIIRSVDADLVTISDEGEEGKELINSITWYSYSAKINSEDEARAIMKALKTEEQIDGSDAGSYDSALIAFQDASNVQSQEMERSKIYAGDEEKQEAHIVLTYLKYNYLMLRIRRDITLLADIERKNHGRSTRVSVLENVRDCLKMLNGVSTSLSEIRDLPGVSNDDDLVATLNSLDSYFETQKIVKLANGYSAVNKFKESLALLQKAKNVIDLAATFKIDLPGNLPNNEKLASFKEQVESQLRKVHVLTVYDEQTDQYKSEEFIIDSTDKFPEISGDKIIEKIAPLNLTIEPVSVKPVLFDIAFNYINYRGEGVRPAAPGEEPEELKESQSESEMEMAPSEVNKKKSGRFFGFFGR
ncbi:DEKNAAC100180 [Brettanomyces naardenensis]|uniref:Signal recognition particle subunit SRP68 n=1 Tax=Brettanomyces naardenensis TaxID=13370 RepID=A0A448YFS5_BRENA|nr:DEKNAAC100180 [Brettanomyces naardenensis]